jgi:hypothetical protein
MPAKSLEPSLTESENVAAQAFFFLCDDQGRIERFLRLTGLDAADLPELAGERSFLTGVLDHLLGDEALLLTFCANRGIEPESIAAAQRHLNRISDEGSET